MGLAERLPRIVGLQPVGYSTLVTAMERGWTSDQDLRDNAPTSRPPTVQLKIAHTVPPDGAEALAAVRESNGLILATSDDEALAGVKELGAREGLYVEPSSGIVVSAVRRLVADGIVAAGDRVVAVVCGGGHRESAAIAASLGSRPRDVTREELGRLLRSGS